MCRCRNCLCCSCMNVCCDCKKCTGKKNGCEKYRGFQQLNLFDTPNIIHKKLTRYYTWQDYNISKTRYKELKELCQSGEYTSLVRSAAHIANLDIEEYIYLSVTKKLSYEGLQRLWELKEIKQMPYCRTDFYGYRRLFYSQLDKELRKRNIKTWE